MKTRTKIFIVLGSILGIIIILFGVAVYKDLQIEGILENDYMTISNLIDQQELDKANEELNDYISTGDYLVVEKAYKNYLRSRLEHMSAILSIINDDRITQVLTAQNYQEDGKDFVNSKAYLETAINTLKEAKTAYLNDYEDDVILSYIEDEDVDSYYVEFYCQLVAMNILSEEEKDLLDQDLEATIVILQKCDAILDFLIENKDGWEVIDGSIYFTTDELANEYNSMIEDLTSDEKTAA